LSFEYLPIFGKLEKRDDADVEDPKIESNNG